MRNRAVTVVMLLVATLGIASCSSHTRGVGHVDGAAAPTLSEPAIPSGSPVVPPSGSSTQHSGGGGATSSPSRNAGPPKVTATIDPIAGYTGTNCPYKTVATGTVSVDHGPISIRVVWSPNYVIRLVGVLELNFPGNGPQSARVSFTLQPPPDDTNVSVTLQLNQATGVIPLATSGFTMICKAEVSRPTVTDSRGACPYTAYWTSTITMSYPDDHVAYAWYASNMGMIGSGTLDFSKAGSMTVTSPPVSVLTHKVGTDFVVTLKVTSPPGGSNGSAARCTSIPSP